jgi:NitT/TauT family transport system substrate-binding protein
MSRKIAVMILAALLALTVLGGTVAQDDAPTLRIGVLPVLNTLPLYVAQAQGFYEAEGVNVELVPFDSAPNQQVAAAAGEVDGLNTDIVVAALINAGGFKTVIVRSDPPAVPFFAIIAGAGSGVESIDDLKGVEIAISENSIIEYVTTTLLENAGFSADDIAFTSIPQIPVRLELLAQGQIAAATLPEPLTTLSTQLQGGLIVADDRVLDFVPTVLVFRREVVEANPEAIAAFLRAYESAVDAINTDPEAYREVLIGNINIPQPLQATYPVPSFLPAFVPSEEQAGAVLAWMVDRGLLEEAPAYEDFVTDAYLPEELAAPAATPEAES